MAVLFSLGVQLHSLGHGVSFALREDTPALRAALPAHIPCHRWEDLSPSPECCWLVPEGWPQALLPGLQAQARCVIYVQNWAYFLANMPENSDFSSTTLRCLAVSDPVRHYIHHTTGQDCPVLRPAIDPTLFFAPERTTTAPHKAHPAINGPIRVAYMPRKNTALARYIREATTARLRHAHPHIGLEWLEIQHKSPQEVAASLRHSHIFLATGFPEGLGLPPLEAMASGCIVVGFTGLGGWDYMRQAISTDSAPFAPYAPAIPLRPVPWGGNGFYTADADVLGAAQTLEKACLLLHMGGPELTTLREAAALTAAAYSPQAQASAVQDLWENWI